MIPLKPNELKTGDLIYFSRNLVDIIISIQDEHDGYQKIVSIKGWGYYKDNKNLFKLNE